MSKRPTDDLEPAAKKGKRGNARQLTKDDASDEEEEVAPGEMTKASADVMKGRRVVKARRGAGPAAPSASANPFGGFSLLAQPDEPGEEALETAVPPEKGAVGNSITPPAPAEAAPSKPAEALAPAASTDTTKAILSTPAAAPAAAAADTASKPPDAPGSAAVTGPVTAVVSSGAAVTALPTGSAAAPAAEATATSSSPAPSQGGFAGFGKGATGFGATFSGSGGFGALAGTSAPSFGLLSSGSQPGFGFASQEGSKPLPSFFPALSREAAAPSGSAPSTGAVLPAASTPPKTGEEGETCRWSGEGVLYEFAAEAWKERGRGEMRVNTSPAGDEPSDVPSDFAAEAWKAPGCGELRVNTSPAGNEPSGRLVMRTKGTSRLLLNGPLWPRMALTPMEGGKGVTFACMNAAAHKEGSESPPLTTFAFRCKSAEARDALMAAINAHKGQAEQNGQPQTNGKI